MLKQALAHGGVAALLIALLASAASLPAGGVAGSAAVAWAFLTGLALSHIIHEWCHFFGARLAGSTLSLKPAVHPL
ncbi:MAG: hypothetical protein OEW92_12615, partial [Gammaproteobacteria bacterium]|nr:hypothetical protein [Gammaproteobacteria bacterium]